MYLKRVEEIVGGDLFDAAFCGSGLARDKRRKTVALC
jgi:hypothetical protein